MDDFNERQAKHLVDLKKQIRAYKKSIKHSENEGMERTIKRMISDARENFTEYQNSIKDFEDKYGVGRHFVEPDELKNSKKKISLKKKKSEELVQKEKEELKEKQKEFKYHTKKICEFRDMFKKLEKQFKTSLKVNLKSELFNVKIEGSNSNSSEEELKKQRSKKLENERKIERELFKEIFEIQDENIQIVINLVDKAEECNVMAAEITTELKSQNEQLVGISKNLDNVGSAIRRAGNELRSFLRGLATEKLVVVFICLVLCVIVSVVVAVIICKVGVCKLICTNLAPDQCPDIIM